MGGGMGMFADLSGINFKILNSSKGAAVRSTRVQVDRSLYKSVVNNFLLNLKNLDIIQQTAIDVIIRNNRIIGVITDGSLKFYSKSSVFTLGTFLNGKIFIGNTNYHGGRIGELPSNLISLRLKDYFSAIGRLKTGTPPRINKKSVNLDFFGIQKSDYPIPFFSFWGCFPKKIINKDCYVVHTNSDTHKCILDSLNVSSIYNGSINVVGPRYCPSIEDKVIRFREKLSHQIFLEPEDINGYELYPNGLSSSIPLDNQIEFLKSIKGFSNVSITRPGYAVEYDFFDPRILKNTLETKDIQGLFFAGQINGTTGYEEAGAQGLIAGINAACYSLDKGFLVLSRFNSYIGVLIDDLVTKGVDEPYRMFTSRAEYRLLLREDNADLRLTERAKRFGLISDYKWKLFSEKYDKSKFGRIFLNKKKIKDFSFGFLKLKKFFNVDIFKEGSFLDLLKYQNINFRVIKIIFDVNLPDFILNLIEIKVKYSGYLNKQYSEIKKLNKFRYIKIPYNTNYKNISGLSLEISEKLNLVKPNTLTQAIKIPGVTLSSLLILLMYLKKYNKV